MKNIIKICLLLFIVGSLVYLGIKQTNNYLRQNSPLESQVQKKDAQLKVYYFHQNKRCSTCKKIEAMAKQSLEENFLPELKTKKIVFELINIDLPHNEHFINEFSLNGSSLVLVSLKTDKIVSSKTLNRVWHLTSNQSQFNEYIKTEIQKILGNKS